MREPPATWLIARYAKLGPARFTSARDVARLMERALKRAGLPVAYSSGFNPHQRVAYAFPAPTGAQSLAEYALIAMTCDGDAGAWRDRLNQQLPDGVRVEAAETTGDRHLPARLEASRWVVDWPWVSDAAGLGEAVAAFGSSPSVVVQRRAKSETGPQDVRQAVVSIGADGPQLTVVLRQAERQTRPTDVWQGLTSLQPALRAWGGGLLTRQAQGALTDGGDVVNLV